MEMSIWKYRYFTREASKRAPASSCEAKAFASGLNGLPTSSIGEREKREREREGLDAASVRSNSLRFEVC